MLGTYFSTCGYLKVNSTAETDKGHTKNYYVSRKMGPEFIEINNIISSCYITHEWQCYFGLTDKSALFIVFHKNESQIVMEWCG